ncbi:glycosyltransferase family 9 protein [Klebsiella sp. BIGb0407]|uniref:glycosyltransferase family 9 protein n=1 Tax=Klebsiella sp. BIGb0407 TaxID=2940603 RepID=UPI00216719E8|nr:glycosyltransferase family 9 protein [Klebsiella sp. BIGb0407]MCS3432012.1 ADP-heptose:LPS heptosyltransferase [Klebsiella sp. BIGb0407]
MKILIIRRDNIGDLILTTPLISELAKSFDCKIDVLINTYNQPVLENNPHIGRVHIYSKLHHRKPGQSAIGVIFRRLKTYLDIRFAKYDVAIIAREHWNKRPLQWARISGAKRIIAVGNDTPPVITDRIPSPVEKCHLVELLAELAKPIGVKSLPGKLELYLTEDEVKDMSARLRIPSGTPVYGIQISARKPLQRWQAEKFIELAHKMSQRENCHILLFWSPGSSDNQEHPGDDEKAQQIIESCKGLSLTPVITKNIRELMAAMSLCDQILTSDGGALHIAAGVDVPTVAMFGNSDAWFWGPWGVPHEILEAPNRNVNLLEVDDVFERFITLRSRVISEESGSSVLSH